MEKDKLDVTVEHKDVAPWIDIKRKIDEDILVGTRSLEINKMLSEWLKTRIERAREETNSKT